MHILGSISDNGKVFNFENRYRFNKSHSVKNNFTFSGNKIFIYIDGNISKLSNEIIELTHRFDSINQKFHIFTSLGLILKIIYADLLIFFCLTTTTKNLN